MRFVENIELIDNDFVKQELTTVAISGVQFQL